VRSYYRTRFDPFGSTREEKRMLERRIAVLLQRLAATSAGASLTSRSGNAGPGTTA
jgi:hypothetical protein